MSNIITTVLYDRLWTIVKKLNDYPDGSFEAEAVSQIGEIISDFVKSEQEQLLDEIIADRPLTTQYVPLNLYIERIEAKRKQLNG